MHCEISKAPRGRWLLGLLLMILLALGLCACDSDDAITCTCDMVPAIRIEVLDATTMRPAACDATGYLIDGSYVEEIESWFDCHADASDPNDRLEGALERPGIYTVVIEKTGYKPWARSGILVLEDRCHVITVQLRVLLEPEG